MTSRSPDVDRGWAFIGFAGFFFSYVLIFGIGYCPSLFYNTFLNEFEQTPTFTAWSINLSGFCIFFFGELANFCISTMGHRWTVIIGCVMSFLGLLLTSFANSLLAVLFSLGLLTGIGLALPFIAAIDMIAVYFKKYRTTMYSLGSSGSGLGQFIYPPLLVQLFERYFWRGGLLILSAMYLNFLVIAAVFMPPRLFESDREEAVPMTSNAKDRDEADDAPKRMEKSKSSTCDCLSTFVANARVLQNPFFLAYIFSTIIFSIGESAFFTHIVNLGLIKGYDLHSSAMLASLPGIGSVTGRLLMGLLFRVRKFRVIGIHVILSFGLGLACALAIVMPSYPALATCSFTFGFFFSVVGIFPEVCIHIVGLKRLSAGVSYACLLTAFGKLLGGPIAAALYEIDPSYRMSFLTGGLLTMLSAFMNIPAWITWEDGKLGFRRSFHDEVDDIVKTNEHPLPTADDLNFFDVTKNI